MEGRSNTATREGNELKELKKILEALTNKVKAIRDEERPCRIEAKH